MPMQHSQRMRYEGTQEMSSPPSSSWSSSSSSALLLSHGDRPSSIALLCFRSPSHFPIVSSKNSVSVFWDLDNKPPKFSPSLVAFHLRRAAAQFGNVVDMVACANRHAFLHIPKWVHDERKERRHLVCGMCGWDCETNLDLKRHFKLIHEREQHKMMQRLQSLRGKKKLRSRQTMYSKYQSSTLASGPILVPNLGYGLDSELRRAGVSVRRVDQKPQAADRALKRQIMGSINNGVECICLVTDDSDFSDILKKARARSLRTIVIGDTNCLQQFADVWYPWDKIAQGLLQDNVCKEGDITAENLRPEDADCTAPCFFPLGEGNKSLATFKDYAFQKEQSAFLINSSSRCDTLAFWEELENVHAFSEDENVWVVNEGDKAV